MTREEAQKAIKNNSDVYCVESENPLDKTFSICRCKAGRETSMLLDGHDMYEYTPKDAIITWCMIEVECLTRKIEECKESVGWDYKIRDKG